MTLPAFEPNELFFFYFRTKPISRLKSCEEKWKEEEEEERNQQFYFSWILWSNESWATLYTCAKKHIHTHKHWLLIYSTLWIDILVFDVKFNLWFNSIQMLFKLIYLVFANSTIRSQLIQTPFYKNCLFYVAIWFLK